MCADQMDLVPVFLKLMFQTLGLDLQESSGSALRLEDAGTTCLLGSDWHLPVIYGDSCFLSGFQSSIHHILSFRAASSMELKSGGVILPPV